MAFKVTFYLCKKYKHQMINTFYLVGCLNFVTVCGKHTLIILSSKQAFSTKRGRYTLLYVVALRFAEYCALIALAKWRNSYFISGSV